MTTDASITRYALFPGWATSKADGLRHYIDAPRLAQLYGVPYCECMVVRRDAPRWETVYRPKGMIELHPRYDGDYTIPGA